VLGDLRPVIDPDQAPGEVADPLQAMLGRCRGDCRGSPVLHGLQLHRVLHAQADMHAVHACYGAVHRLGVGDRALQVLKTVTEPLACPPGVAHEKAHMVAVGEQPPGDRRPDQPGRANDQDAPHLSAQALGRRAGPLRHVAADDLGDQLHRRQRAEEDRQLPD